MIGVMREVEASGSVAVGVSGNNSPFCFPLTSQGLVFCVWLRCDEREHYV